MQNRQPGRLDLDFHRKQAKRLLRAFRAREPEALVRAERVLGTRAELRFVLSDAQHVVAVESGHRSWPELRRAAEAPELDRTEALRAELAAARATWGERGEVLLDTGSSYVEGEPVLVLVRKRGRRYDIGDRAAAVDLAGRPSGWLDVARAVAEEGLLNVNRRGVVFVPAVESRDHTWLALRVADTSLALYEALLDLDG